MNKDGPERERHIYPEMTMTDKKDLRLTETVKGSG